MRSLFPLLNLCLLSSLIGITQAADCDQNQKRQTGDPSGNDIGTALTKDNQLSTVCSGDFPPGNDKISTYNHWNMIYNVTRIDPSQGLQGCLDGFQNIIDQCISGGNYWGGTWSLNGFTYAIYNHAYPSNGLGPNDSGGPSSTDDSNPTTTDEPESITTGIGATTSSDRGGDVPPSTAAPSIPGETIVTETNSDGAPITATFAPTTLSQYATLKSEITVTTTTTRDGVPIIFPLVIGAGGVAWGIVGAPPPGITPPGGVPGDGGDGDDGDDGDDGSGSIQSQTPTSTIFSSSIASSTGAAVTAIGDINYDDWQAINQVPLQPNGPTPDGDDFGAATTKPAAQTATISGAICVLPPGSNDPACHPISPNPPTPTSTPPPSPTSTIAITPTGIDVNCLTGQPAGTRMIDCFGMLGRFSADQKVCTNDPGACLSSGDSYCKASGGKCDPDGGDFLDTSNYCMLAQSSGCAFVIANKQSSFGFPGSSCVTGTQLDQYIRGAANKCAGDGTIALQVGPDVSNGVRQDTYCLISQDQPGVCGA